MKPHFFLDQSGSFLETKYITRSTMSKEKYYYRGSRRPLHWQSQWSLPLNARIRSLVKTITAEPLPYFIGF
jgi:hypothetical protein